MVAPIQGIIRNVLKKPLDKCNVLSIIHDGFFEKLLAQTKHNFYTLVNEQPNWLTQTINNIDNLQLCKNTKDVPNHVSIDVVLCNNRIKFFDQAKILSRLSHTPLIVIDHLDISGLKPEDIFLINKNTGNFQICASNVFGQISNISYTDIIPYGVEIPDNIIPIKDRRYPVVVLGDYSREQQLLSVLKNQFGTLVINNENHPRTFSEISNIVSNSKIYLNLSSDSNISIPTLIAMSQGCVIINNKINPLSRILNGANGVIYDNSQNLLVYIQQLLNNQHKLQTISNSAVETIRIQFNQQRFINQWDLIFSQLANIVYKL